MTATTAAQWLEEINRVTGTASPDPGTVPQALADRFAAAMAHSAPYAPAVHPAGQDNLVMKAIEEQANNDRVVPNDVLYMAQHMSGLSLQRMFAANMTVQFEIASANVDMQVKMGIVQSSKESAQTLMKNQ